MGRMNKVWFVAGSRMGTRDLSQVLWRKEAVITMVKLLGLKYLVE